MKKLLKILITASIMMMVIHVDSTAQCDTDEFLDKCASNLGTYNYIKTFISYANPRKKSVPENIYVFSKGSTYKLIACQSEPVEGKMVISLFDRNHNLIACTYDQNTNKYYSELQYPCSVTGVYYIKTSFEGIKNGCGMCILGFSKEE